MEKFSVPEIAKRAGGYARLAEAAGVQRTTPYRWRRIPANHVIAVGRLIGVTPDQIRPDVFLPPVIPGGSLRAAA